jgi:hypothetical protein
MMPVPRLLGTGNDLSRDEGGPASCKRATSALMEYIAAASRAAATLLG